MRSTMDILRKKHWPPPPALYCAHGLLLPPKGQGRGESHRASFSPRQYGTGRVHPASALRIPAFYMPLGPGWAPGAFGRRSGGQAKTAELSVCVMTAFVMYHPSGNCHIGPVTAQWSTYHVHFIDEEIKDVRLDQDHRTGTRPRSQPTF